jgi:hypothetical protein
VSRLHRSPVVLAGEAAASSEASPKKKEQPMATRQIKMPRKDGSENKVDEAPSQLQRPESGRYLLQVDRQTKSSYPTAEAAQSAALVIKKGYPALQVSIYDRVGNTNTLVDLPVASR